MNIFDKFLWWRNKTQIVHVFLAASVQNQIFWNALNFEIPVTQKKIVIGDFSGIYTKHRFHIPFSHNGRGYDFETIRECVRRYFSGENEQYIFYATDKWAHGLIPFLHYLPSKKIKSIMIYEESVGDIFIKDTRRLLLSAKELKENIDNLNVMVNPPYQYAFHTLYPTTYYVGFKDFLLTSKDHAGFCNYLRGANLEDLNFQKLSNTLLNYERHLIFKSFKFNFKWYKEMTHNKEVHIFIVGHGTEGYDKDKVKKEKLIIDAIKHWYKKYYRNDEQLLFIKPGRSKRALLELLEKNDIKIPIFPYRGPFELLILAGLLPKTVSGTDCSLYVNIPDEMIGTIYENGPWTSFLKKTNRIKENQIEIL